MERTDLKVRIKFAGASSAAAGVDPARLAELLARSGGGGPVRPRHLHLLLRQPHSLKRNCMRSNRPL